MGMMLSENEKAKFKNKIVTLDLTSDQNINEISQNFIFDDPTLMNSKHQHPKGVQKSNYMN
jgi:hypothetical protein